MTPEQSEQLNYHAKQIATILYADIDPDTLQPLGDIERVVREKMLQSVSPNIGIFLSKPAPKPRLEEPER